MKLKDLKIMRDNGIATDITKYSDEDITELINSEGKLECIERTVGTYGMSGGLFKARNSRKMYVITSRNSNLFRLA